MNIIKKLPVPIAGVMLALFSLGNILYDINPNLKTLFGLFGAIIFIMIVLKIISYPKDIIRDLKNPVIASSSGTFSMSVMLLSTYLIDFIPSISYSVWICGICLHIMLMIYFTYHFIIRDFDISTVYPSYWIVYVGITMAAITSPAYHLEKAGFIFFTIGFLGMLLTTPTIFYRYIRYPQIPDANKPLICIFTALMSILIVGYAHSTSDINLTFITTLYTVGCIFYIFAFVKLIEYRNLDFYPSFAAFTFPFVISALATKEILKIANYNFIINSAFTLESAVALLVVIYVSIRYINFLKKEI